MTDDATMRLPARFTAAIVDGAPNGIVVTDDEGRILEVNPAAERTFGLRRERAVGQRFLDVVLPPARRRPHGDGLLHALTTDHAMVLGRPVELTAVHADGHEIVVELALARTVVDGAACVIVQVRDVTDRARAEDAGRRRAEQLAALQQLAPAALWTWNPATDEGFASAEAYRLFGAAGDETPTAPVALADLPRRIHPEDRPLYHAVRAAAVRDHAPFDVTYRVSLPDGGVRHLRALGRPMFGPSGEFREFVGTLLDVTEQRRATADAARHARDVALRADIGGVFARSMSMRAMLHECAESIVRHFDAAFARIWTVRRGGAVLELQASAGAYTRLDGAHARVPVGALKIGLIARDRTAILTNDVLADPRIEDVAWARREGIVAFAGYPLVVEERVVGVMAMFARHALEPETLDTLASVSAAIAQGIERKRAEEELRRSEAYLTEGQRLTHTGSWAWNLATGEIYFSLEMFRIYGFAPADHAPPYEAVLQRAHPDDAPEVQRALQEAFRTGTELRLLTRILVPGQPLKWVETFGHPVRDADGTLLEFIGTVVDVTERVRAARRQRRAVRERYAAVLAERTRIARDMHDGLLQDVAAIALQLGALLPHVQSDPAAAVASLRRIIALTERTGRDARHAVVDMRAPAEPVDLVSAVRRAAPRAIAQAAAAAPVPTLAVHTSGRARPMPAGSCEAILSIVREALTNVLKHASATAVEIVVTFRARAVHVSVRDDGRGFALPADDAVPRGHFGIVGMRERAASIGASLTIERAPGRGTVLTLTAPYGR